MSGEIEDESHFVVDCAFYDDLREKFKNVLMKEGIEFGEERKTEAGKKRLLQLLLGTGLQERTRRRQAPRNFELLPRRYAPAASRCFAAGPKNLKRDFLAPLYVVWFGLVCCRRHKPLSYKGIDKTLSRFCRFSTPFRFGCASVGSCAFSKTLPRFLLWMDGVCFIKNTASEALSTRVSGSSGDQINNY
jgi:hypothetical protein